VITRVTLSPAAWTSDLAWLAVIPTTFGTATVAYERISTVTCWALR
jgi:hypothetical protein